jgi:protein-tyrosine-phosphatase
MALPHWRLNFLLWLAALLPGAAFGHSEHEHAARPSRTVVFVCEHGSAKSLIAAQHFNRLAQARGLDYRAVSRGTSPDAAIPAGVQKGLEADGLSARGMRPTAISASDVAGAVRVVSFAAPLAVEPAHAAKLVEWRDVPAVSKDYGVAREDIVKRVSRLIAELP